MDVAGLEAEPVHGRQMADRIARVGVDDELARAVVPEVK